MMAVTIDPSDTRPTSQPAAAGRRVAPLVRTLILGTLGGIGLVGFSVGAYSMLGQLARPQPAKVTMSRQAAEWPDLKDGIPAMAPASREAPKPVSRWADARPASEGMPVTALAGIAAPSSRKAIAPLPPPIEVATVIGPTRLAPSVALPPMASLVPPTSAETVRARAVETRLAALPAEPAAAPAARPARKPTPAIARAKPAPEPAAAAAAAPPLPAEAEETEVFGMKVPSLASSGRKLVEGVQSLGDAVARQF